MASESPSPNPSPNGVPPVSSVNSHSPPPIESIPNHTTHNTLPPPSNPSAPPPPVPSTPPPLPLPLASPLVSPPPLPPASPPLPHASPPVSPPPPSCTALSPTSDSPPPPTLSPPPLPPSVSPPPKKPLASPEKQPPSPPPPPPSHPEAAAVPPPAWTDIAPSPVSHPSLNRSRRDRPLPSFPTEKPTGSALSSQNVTATANSVNSEGLRPRVGTTAVLSSFVGFLTLTVLVLAMWVVNRRRKNNAGSNINHSHAAPLPFASYENSGFLRPQYSSQPCGNASTNNFTCSSDGGMGTTSRSWFTYEELSEATNGFSTNNLLGEGGFGCVYKGVLIDGRQVAVKQLKAGGGQGEREFRAEVEIISRVHHKHLVSLVGYCISENQRLLVYDYVPNNTLHYHLHDEGKPVMDWASRVKVAAGAARGLAYLHEDCQPRIIHRDIKSTNILLDNNFEALVADFGLAKIALELDLNTHVSTRVMGTFGYLAPEYASTGKLTEKSDVFSFGVVLLELITGRKPVDSSKSPGDESLVEWARPLLAQTPETQVFEDLIDPRLGNNFIESEMFGMIDSAAACVRHSASIRPRMSQIARALDSMDELADLSNGMRPGESGIFDSMQHAAHVRMFDRMAFGNEDRSSDFFNRSQSSWRS